MAVIDELTLTYKRTHQVQPYEPEEIFLAMKISLESQDQSTKSITDLINHGLKILQSRVDAHMSKSAPEISRQITVTNQDGKGLPVPEKFKGEDCAEDVE